MSNRLGQRCRGHGHASTDLGGASKQHDDPTVISVERDQPASIER
jgi:hypothetical protein